MMFKKKQYNNWPKSIKVIISNNSNNKTKKGKKKQNELQQSAAALGQIDLFLYTYYKTKREEGGTTAQFPATQKFSNEKQQVLARETVLIILKYTLQFMHDMSKDLSKARNCQSGGITDKLFQLLVFIMEKNQSMDVLINIMDTLHYVVKKFSSVIFKYPTWYCEEICYHVLRFCNSKIQKVRERATVVITLMIVV